MTITERIGALIEEKGLKPSVVADSLNIARSNLTRWKQKEYIPSSEHIIALSQYFQVTTDWLLTGKEPIQKNDLSADGLPHDEIIKKILPVEELILLGNYRDLPVEKKLDLQEWAKQMLAAPSLAASVTKVRSINKTNKLNAHAAIGKSYAPRKSSPPDKDKIITIRKQIFDAPASAGFGSYLDEYSSYEMLEFNKDDVPAAADCGIRISGDSMEPVIKDGSIVWVRYQPAVDNGDIGIFCYEGEAYCKKIDIDYKQRKIFLLSINESYPPKEITNEDELRTIGKVLKVRSFF